MASLLPLVPTRLVQVPARAKPRTASRQPSLRAFGGRNTQTGPTAALGLGPTPKFDCDSPELLPSLSLSLSLSLLFSLPLSPSRQLPFRHSQSLRQQPRRPPCLLPSSLAPTRPSSSPMTVSRLPYVPGPCFRFWSYAQWMEGLYIGIKSRRSFVEAKRKTKKKKFELEMLSRGEKMRVSTQHTNWADL